MKTKEHFLQLPLVERYRNFNFIDIKDSLAVYDAFCEILPEFLKKKNSDIESYDFAVDLYGMKRIRHIKNEYILTCQPGVNNLLSYAKDLKPMEANVQENLPGNEFHLRKTSDTQDTKFFYKIQKCHDPKELKYFYGLRKQHFTTPDSEADNQKKQGNIKEILKQRVISVYSNYVKIKTKRKNA